MRLAFGEKLFDLHGFFLASFFGLADFGRVQPLIKLLPQEKVFLPRFLESDHRELAEGKHLLFTFKEVARPPALAFGCNFQKSPLPSARRTAFSLPVVLSIFGFAASIPLVVNAIVPPLGSLGNFFRMNSLPVLYPENYPSKGLLLIQFDTS